MKKKVLVYLLMGLLLLTVIGTVHSANLSQTQVSQLYVSIFGRASEGEGNAYWCSNQDDMVVAANTMLNTEPAKAYFGTTLNDNQLFIEFIYKNTLGKTYAEDPEGVDYWVSELATGKSKGQIVATLINAAMDPIYTGLTAQDQFINKVTVCNYTADMIATCPDVNNLSAFVGFISGITDAIETVLDTKDEIDAFAVRELGELAITDYFPESGPAGTYLSLKLANPISALGTNFTVLYNQKALDINTIVKTGEDTLQVTVPADAESGDIQVVFGSAVSNTVLFSVKPTVTTMLLSQSVSPSATDQVINYNDDILITIPSDILDTTRSLSITKVEGAPVNSTAPFAVASAFDVSIEGLEQLNGYIEIKEKYNPDLLNPGYPAEDQFMAMRWNEAEQFWLPLPYQVDTANNTLSFYTDHLTLVEWVVIGAIAVAAIPVTWVGEKLLNDVYVTPNGNFRLLYSKASINDHPNLNDSTWEKITYKNPFYPLAAYQPEHPRFIQDMGNLHETALSSYVKANEFQDPIVKPGNLWGTTVNPITVKIDSWWVDLGGAPNYEKLWENIHLPTLYLSDFDTPDYTAYGTIGHELFHRIQAEYYGIFGFSSYMWWIEACAEYAGFRAAWQNNQLDGLRDGIKADFFSYPLNKTGVPSGWGDKEYQYAVSVFIQFLVETKGLDLKEMVEYVSQGDPLTRLGEFLLLKLAVSLKDFYAEFAAWAVFSENGFMNKSGFSAADIAEQFTSFSIPENDILTIEVAAESDEMFVNVYITEENQRFPDDGTPDLQGKLKNGESLDIPVSNLGQSNVLYLLAVTGKENAIVQEDPYNDSINSIPQTGLTVTVKNKNKNPVEQIKRSFTLEGNYLAKLWGVNLEYKLDIEESCNFGKVTISNQTPDSVTLYKNGERWESISANKQSNSDLVVGATYSLSARRISGGNGPICYGDGEYQCKYLCWSGPTFTLDCQGATWTISGSGSTCP